MHLMIHEDSSVDDLSCLFFLSGHRWLEKHAWLRAVQCRTWSKWLLLFWPHFQKISSNIMSTLGATKLSSFQTWVIRTPKSLSVSFQIRKEKVPKKQFFWQFCSSDPGYTMGRCCSVSAYYDQYGGHAVCLKLADLSPRPLLFLRNVLGSERLVMSIILYDPRWYILFHTFSMGNHRNHQPKRSSQPIISSWPKNGSILTDCVPCVKSWVRA